MSVPQKLLIGAGLAVGSVALIGAIIIVANRYLNAQELAANAKFAACNQQGNHHTVTIKNDIAVPDHITAPLCDTLTIENADDEIRVMAFGPHENHQPYDGVTEETLGPGQSLTVVLNQLGTYQFHDHIHDEVRGDFTVTK